jgi:hypothetical protein
MEELVAMGISVPPEIIPELKKLIKDLKTGNLTKDEFMEISEQLAGNEDASAPRQNTELPLSDPDDESTKTSGNHGDREEGKIPNPGKERSTHRNLVALNRAYNDSEVETKNKKAKIIIVEHPVVLHCFSITYH